MRALKISGVVLGCLVAVVVVLLLGVWLFVNPNDYKGRIEQDVKASTGRDLVLTGPIKLAVFPWIALRLGPASLGNPPGFGSQPFASVQYASLRVRLWPLLRKQLSIGRIEVDGLDLHLMRDARGQGNWQSQSTASSNAAATSASGGLRGSIAGVVVRGSRVSYQGMVLDDVSADVGRLSADRTGYRLDHFSLKGTFIPKAGARAVTWGFSVPSLSLDLAAQTLSAPSFAAQLAAARLTGSLEGTRVIEAPSFTGAFRLAPLALRAFMSQMGMDAPATRDPTALSRLAASGDFSYGGDAARAQNLDVQLDESTLKGTAAVSDLASHAMSFDLALDRIDIDRYLSAAPGPAPAAPAAPRPVQLPTSALKGLQLAGTATIGSATVERLRLGQVRVTLQAKDGVLHIAPATAQLYGGTYSGDITLDTRGGTPALALNQTLSGVQVAPLLNDFAKIDRISGRGNVTTHLMGHGLTSDAVIASLNGQVTANLANGAVQGLDLWFEINRAIALAQRHAMPAGKDSGRTPFSAFKASADLAQGVATTHDLEIASQDLRVTGHGTLNLATEAINYRLQADILRGAAANGAGGHLLADIPLDVGGTLTSPAVRPDLEQLAKAAVKGELSSHKQELQQKLEDKLKTLLR